MNTPRVLASKIMSDLKNWTPREWPHHKTLGGERFVKLEPLAEKHAETYYEAATCPDSDQRFKYLWEETPKSVEEIRKWIRSVKDSRDPMFFAVVDLETGKVGGRQSYLRIEPNHGVAEIGHIYWGPLISKRPQATEAFYLALKHLFDDLGYRRVEWKCHGNNKASMRAAERFGLTYEGTFRQHMIMKGGNRDTPWFSIIDKDWPKAKKAFELWLDPENFDENGQQKRRLEDVRNSL